MGGGGGWGGTIKKSFPCLDRESNLLNPALTGVPSTAQMWGVDRGTISVDTRKFTYRPSRGASRSTHAPIVHNMYMYYIGPCVRRDDPCGG